MQHLEGSGTPVLYIGIYEVQSKSNAYIFIVTVQELLLQPR